MNRLDTKNKLYVLSFMRFCLQTRGGSNKKLTDKKVRYILIKLRQQLQKSND